MQSKLGFLKKNLAMDVEELSAEKPGLVERGFTVLST
jgi:hypothetical protein